MAMLAEPKRKQRWSLNPRGKHWSDAICNDALTLILDSNKFGQKMLEKMGWSSGKGLGANLDGIKEHVKISYKNDSQGMGFKENGEQWTQHEDKFSALLENLTEATAIATTDVKADRSLEEKSRSSRSRLHYHKFTRGKDLSGRSSKDLAAIFGRKTLERSVEADEPPNMQSETEESKAHGVLTIQAGNMQAYFKSKMPANTFSLNTMKDDSESEMHSCGGLGFGALPFVETKKRKRDHVDVQETISKVKSKKKKHLAFDNQALAVDVFQEACYDNPALDNYPDAETEGFRNASNITKKKLIEGEAGIDNPACEVLDEHENKRSTKKQTYLIIDNPVLNNEEIEDSSKKSKKKQKYKDVGIDNPACEVLNKEEIEETSKKLKKKQKYKDVGIDNPACEVLYKEEIEETSKKLTKKQKYKDVGIDNPACEGLNKEEIEETSKKLKKKQKYKDVGIDNPACEVLNKEELEETSKKLTKKQKYKDVGIDNPACEVLNKEEIEETSKKLTKKQKYKDVGIDNPACESLNKEEIEETSKKLKRKQKYKDVGIDNPACEVLNKEEREQTPKKLKKKQKYNDVGIDNPACEVLNKVESEETARKLKKKQIYMDVGIDNPACEVNTVEESVTSINIQLDSYQNELENEMNEQKILRRAEKNKQKFGLKKKKHLTLENVLQQAHEAQTSKKKMLQTVQKPQCSLNAKTQTPPAQEYDQPKPKLLLPAAVRPTWQPQQPAKANTRQFTRVDKSSLANHVKPGELKLLFKGTNLDQITGYGCIYYK